MGVNAAELLARVRQRKQELSASKPWELWDHVPSNKIYHPEMVIEPPVPMTLHLTSVERVRQRKIAKHAEQEQLRERIKLGIEPPPPPKLKLSNVAAVYGPQYIKDPTHHELLAKQAEEERLNKHKQVNETRHLIAQQNKHQKFANKLSQHREDGLHCIAAKYHEKLDNKTQYIIDYTAKKFQCTGVALMSDEDAYVIIECGEPETIKFEKLTIKLGGSLSWKGPLPAANFKRWSMHNVPDRKKFLKVHGVETMYAK